MENKTVAELVQRMQEFDDENAFEELHKRYYRILYKLAYRMTNNDADAQDMVQDTFIQMRKAIHTLQDPKMFPSWIKQILFNKCKNMFRKNRDYIMDDAMLDSLHPKERIREYIPNEYMRHASTNSIILECIQKLPIIYQGPLLLKYYGEQTMDEIGQELNIPTGTVKSRLRTAKRMLKDEITAYEKLYQTKVDFNLGTLVPTLSFVWLGKQIGSKFSSITSLPAFAPLAIAACVGSACVIVPSAMDYLQGKQTENDLQLPQRVNSNVQINDEYAYFTLRNWAHDKEDIALKSSSEYAEVKPYYEQLKKNQGMYWDLLQNNGWAENFADDMK